MRATREGSDTRFLCHGLTCAHAFQICLVLPSSTCEPAQLLTCLSLYLGIIV